MFVFLTLLSVAFKVLTSANLVGRQYCQYILLTFIVGILRIQINTESVKEKERILSSSRASLKVGNSLNNPESRLDLSRSSKPHRKISLTQYDTCTPNPIRRWPEASRQRSFSDNPISPFSYSCWPVARQVPVYRPVSLNP